MCELHLPLPYRIIVPPTPHPCLLSYMLEPGTSQFLLFPLPTSNKVIVLLSFPLQGHLLVLCAECMNE